MKAKQKWILYVDGKRRMPFQTDAGMGAQKLLNKVKRLYVGRKVEVVAVI